jgi:hypothetical protein
MMPAPMRVSRTWLGLVLLAGLSAAPLAAQQDYLPPKLEVSPFVGAFIGAGLYANVAGQTVTAATKSMIGGRLTWNLSPTFGIEATYSRTTPSLVAPNTALPGIDEKIGTLTLNQFDLSASFAYSSPREAIFFTLGGGIARFSPEIAGAVAGTDTRALLTGGLGYKRFMTPAVGLRIDAKFHGIFTKDATDIGILCGGVTGCFVYTGRKLFSTPEVSAGLVLRL